MFSSLRSRLWLSYLLLIAAMLGVIGISLFIYLIRNPLVYRQTSLHLRIAEGAIALQMSSANPLAGQLQPDQLEKIVQRQDSLLQVRVLLLKPDGSVIVDSRQGAAPPLRPIRRPLVIPTDSQTPAIRDTNGNVWQYTLRRLDDQTYLLVALPRPRIQLATLLRDEFGLLITRAGGIALVLALVLGLVMARWIAAPLQRMAAAARSLAAGKHQVIPIQGPREVQDLAQAFNEMTDRVEASRRAQRDFVANVSHELKTPITSIQGFAQAILDGAASTPQALRQAAGVIFSEAGRMSRLVVDLLTLARLDAGTANLDHAPLVLDGLLRSILEKMSPQANAAQVELKGELQPLPRVIGDEDRLAQVFTNLIDNALKFTPAGGRVTLTSCLVKDHIEISVADTGPGLSKEEQSRIFERFYQADRSRQGGSGHGVGLGLAIAREIVQAHGGNIRVTSQPGEGSRFTIALPVLGEGQASRDGKKLPSQGAR